MLWTFLIRSVHNMVLKAEQILHERATFSSTPSAKVELAITNVSQSYQLIYFKHGNV